MIKPRAVVISDIHYNINTLAVADAALRQAVAKSNELKVPLIIAGDLHDTKANIRGECIKAMLQTLFLTTQAVYILRGNHDSINERSTDHSLEFLTHLSIVIDVPWYAPELGVYLIPYHHDADALRAYLSTLPPDSTLIMHQGVSGSSAGEYIQDKSALTNDDAASFRVISGHYHTRQDIKTGTTGLWSYIGNPYTLNFGECKDPEKGFRVLMSDGHLEFVPTNLRKHVVIDIAFNDLNDGLKIPHRAELNDIVLVKVRGLLSQLTHLDKKVVAERLGLQQAFRIDLIPTENVRPLAVVKHTSNPELLDQLIDSSPDACIEQKTRLKALWKGL